MFAVRNQSPEKKAAQGLPARIAAPADKQLPEANPRWQSLALQAAGIQAKLAVSQPGDPFEQEADRVADHVMRTPLQSVQRKCIACSENNPPTSKDEEEFPVRLKTAGNFGPSSVPDNLKAQLGVGRPLVSGAREFFEPRLGRDLSGVRVHDDNAAARAASSLNAQAFTLGNHIAFAPQKYSPETTPGRQLLAHELVHVVQAGGPAIRRRVEPSPDSETTNPREERATETRGEAPPSETQPAAAGVPTSVAPETCPPPRAMSCPPASSVPGTLSNTLMFLHNSTTLNRTQIVLLDGVAAHWHTAGGSLIVRLDGYASAEGPCEYNWELSCKRAQAVRAALQTPSDGSPGIPAGNIEMFAHGESNAAGPTLAPNRKATVSLPTVPPPPPPAPAPPACLFPVSLGSGRGCGGGTDFTHFDFPSISTGSAAKLAAWAALHPFTGPFRSRVTDLECQAEMAGVLTGLAGSAGLDAFTHFVGGGGSTVVHGASSTLGALALVAPEFLRTVAAVKAAVETQLAAQALTGALNACALAVTPPPTFFASRHFYSPGALKTVIGGTQGERLFATAFTGNIPMRTYSITLRFLICDDFGVDEADLYFFGLFPFWVLQHERSSLLYQPFINELNLAVTVSGTF